MCLAKIKININHANWLFLQEGYQNLLKKFCNVILKDEGVVKGVSTLGTRKFPHFQETRTESGIEKVWRGT